MSMRNIWVLPTASRNCIGARGAPSAASLLALVMAWTAAHPAAAQGKIPELVSNDFAWLGGAEWRDPPRGLRGPIRNDPDFPLRSNRDGVTPQSVRVGNWKDPILKPWAAAQMKAANDDIASGRREAPLTTQVSCYPGGVPAQLLAPATPFYFIQTPTVVYMIWQRDHFVRRIFLTDKHSATVKPSWFGESIGRYDGDDSLVVDTVGLQAQHSYIDNYGTPHSEKLHVTERFVLGYDNSLAAFVRVEDPDTFKEPLFMVQRWRKVPTGLLETVCADDGAVRSGKYALSKPEAKRPDF